VVAGIIDFTCEFCFECEFMPECSLSLSSPIDFTLYEPRAVSQQCSISSFLF